MLGQLEKTFDLIAVLKAIIPFKVKLTPQLLARLRAPNVASGVLSGAAARLADICVRNRRPHCMT